MTYEGLHVLGQTVVGNQVVRHTHTMRLQVKAPQSMSDIQHTESSRECARRIPSWDGSGRSGSSRLRLRSNPQASKQLATRSPMAVQATQADASYSRRSRPRASSRPGSWSQAPWSCSSWLLSLSLLPDGSSSFYTDALRRKHRPDPQSHVHHLMQTTLISRIHPYIGCF